MTKKLLLTLCFSVFTFCAFCQEKDHETLIKEMLEAQNFKTTWEKTIHENLGIQMNAHPELEPEFWRRVENEMLNNSDSIIYTLTIPIYKKHYSIQEIEGIIAFLKSDAGMAMTQKTPFIRSALREAAGALAVEIAPRIIKEIEEDKAEHFQMTPKNCENLKTGMFICYLPDSSQVLIKRDKKHQYEYFNGTTTKFKISWDDNCRYTLTILKTNNKEMRTADRSPLVTNIYEVNEDSYRFVSKKGNIDFLVEGVLYTMNKPRKKFNNT